MNQHRFHTFIFDLDGTLLDTVPDLELLTNDVLQQLGYPPRTREEILSFVGAGVRRLIYLALPEDVSDIVTEQAMDLWNQHFFEYYEHTFPFAGIPEMLDQLAAKGCALGVMSNKLQEGVDFIMQHCFAGRFAAMIGESDVTPRKPDPTGILQVMEALGADPATTVYVGDSPGDIVAAKAAGVFAVAALWGYHDADAYTGPATPDAFVETPAELVEFAA